MQVNKEAQFVLKGNTVVHPPVRTDGLELYYDTKGKKNTDTYKDKLLDMSGNGRHGELQSFSYKNLSGYQENSELVFDGVDDKLALGDVEKPEIISGTKNLFPDSNNWGENLAWGSDGEPIYTPGRSVLLDYISIPKGAATLYISGISLSFQYNRFNIAFYDKNKNFISRSSRVSTKIDSDRGGELLTVPSNAELIRVGMEHYERVGIQLEKGTTATPYVPYIPSIRGTYQLNNNIISYDGGTARWVKDGKVIERKGVNAPRRRVGRYGNGRLTESGNTYRIDAINADSKLEFAASTIYQNRNLYYHSLWIKTSLESCTVSVYTGIFADSTNINRSDEWIKLEFIREAILSGSHVSGSSNTNVYFRQAPISKGDYAMVKDVNIIDLTTTFGAGNEPTLEEIQAEPDKWQWLPNPLDLVESEELKGNILGDMEDIIDDHTRDEQSGVEVFTDKADDSLVRVEVDGKSYQHAGSGKNLFVPVRLKANHSIKENNKLINTIGSEIFYPIESPIGAYTASFSYQHSLNYAPIFMTFYYNDGSSDGDSHGYLDSTSQIRKEMTSNSVKKVVGVGYNAPTVIGVEWDTNPDPNMARYGLALNTRVKTIGVSWDMESNPSMIRSGGLI